MAEQNGSVSLNITKEENFQTDEGKNSILLH